MSKVRNQKSIRFLRKYHKWVSLVLTPFIILFAFSGIVLNHRETFSPVDVNRNYLPANYSYHNWNLAAVKGSVKLNNDSILIYGNIGIWLTDSTFRQFRDFNSGFDSGIDKRKISSLTIDLDQNLWAGTFFGLYRYDNEKSGWTRVNIPLKEKRIVKVMACGDSIFVMSRSHLLISTDQCQSFKEIVIPAAIDHDRKVSLFRTIWMIHSGEIYGLAGKLIMDVIAVIFIILSITGLIYFFVPHILRHIKERLKPGIKRFNKFSLKWHNKLGVWAFAFLVISAITGIFLRPPLLIAIAESRVGAIPGTMMSKANPWFDKLRDFIYDREQKRFIISTSEGFYYSDDSYKSPVNPFAIQPPVSVMGINIFEKVDAGQYLIGSFSGIFSWSPEKGEVIDLITQKPVLITRKSGPPFGSVTVSGYIKSAGNFVIFDYAHGALPLAGTSLPPMPDIIIENSPLSLWGTCLEIHTGRIFENVTGAFYILIVPITGLAILFSLVTGLWLWLKLRRKKAASFQCNRKE